MNNVNETVERALKEGISYSTYRNLIDELLAAGKTTGVDHSEAMLNYSKMNSVRMNRLDKTTVIDKEIAQIIENIKEPVIWLVITEGWCGDAAQIVPVINKMAKSNPLIIVKYVLRDKHEDLINQYLTQGGKSIPKILIIDPVTKTVLGDWGPRPKLVQEMVMSRKKEKNPVPYDIFAKDIQLWYAKDKTKSIQIEFSNKIASVYEKAESVE